MLATAIIDAMKDAHQDNEVCTEFQSVIVATGGVTLLCSASAKIVRSL